MSPKNLKLGLLSISIALIPVSPVSAIDYKSNTLFFPEVAYFDNFDRPETTNTKDSTTSPVISILHAGQYESFTTLFEFSANRHHERVERLQLGWDYSNHHHLWFGRGHTPLGYWNTEYHHGTYLQTSLTRPNPTLTYWPRHITGLSLDGEFNNGIHYDFMFGLGSKIDHGSISDFDIIDPDDEYELSATAKLAYKPSEMSDTIFGVSFAYFELPYEESTRQDFEQYVVNGFINWADEKNRIITEIYYSHTNIPERDFSGDDDFVTAYIQYERIIIPEVTLYGRIEDSFGEENARLIKTFSGYTTEATILGIRYDIFKDHALTFEAASKDKLNDQFNSIAIKWSAVFSW